VTSDDSTVRNDSTAEADLLIGLNRIIAVVPSVRFLIYSRMFRTDAPESNIDLIRDAARKITQRKPATRAGIEMVVNRTKTAYWGPQPSDLERQAVFDIVKDLVQ